MRTGMTPHAVASFHPTDPGTVPSERLRSRAKRDRLVVGFVCAALLAMAIYFGPVERLFEFAVAHGSWRLDVVLTTLFVASMAAAFLAWRRWTDVVAEARAHAVEERDLLDAERRWRAFFLVSPTAIVVVNVGTREIVDTNPEFERLTGYRRREAYGRTVPALGLFATPDLFSRGGDDESIRSLETIVRTATGETRSVLVSSDPVVLDNQHLLLVSLVDISAHRTQEREQAHQAMHDAFSGFFDHAPFVEWTRRALVRSGR